MMTSLFDVGSVYILNTLTWSWFVKINLTTLFRIIKKIFSIIIIQRIFVLQTLLPIIYGHYPAGASVKTLLHFAQVLNSSKVNLLLRSVY